MSGLEVAGLALAAFPLLISALGHYQDLAVKAKIFWKIRKEHTKWMHELRICKLAFERNLQFLLLPLVADGDVIDKLLGDPGGPMWKDPELGRLLEGRLTKQSYDLYHDSIGFINETMDDLGEELGLNDVEFRSRLSTSSGDQTKPWTSFSDIKTNVSFLKRRFKLSINEAKRDDLFKQLTRGNEQLRTLLDTSDQIATLHRDRRVAKKSTDMVGMRQFWKRTDKLYGLLRRSWTCDCRKDHSASLLLKHRTSATTDFQLFLFNGTRDQQDEEELTWKVQEVKVEVLQSMSEECGFKESKVSFATLPSSTPRVTVTARETTDGNIGPSSYEDMIRIRCLCEEIPKFHAHLDRKRPYLLSHADCSVSVHPLLHSSPNATVTAGDMVSLESLLRKSSTRRLTRQARYLIGLTLASSYLQLKFSPWLSHHWTKRDILFPKGKPGKDIVATELPYISQNFELPQCGSDVDARHGTPYDGDDDAADEEDAPADSGGFEPNDHGLKSLGIMLLELCFNTAMEEYGPRMQYVPQQPSGANEPGASNPFLDVAAAFQWSRDVVGEAGPEFSDAIMWCLTTVPNSAARDRMGDRWRDELFERVIMPLKYCCDQFAYQKKTAFVY